MRSVHLPQDLRDALSTLADRLPGKDLARAAAALSSTRHSGLPPRIDDESVRIALAITRIPPVYAAVSTCLEELPFSPESVLVLGAGPGASARAASDRFQPSTLTLIEPHPAWRDIARNLGLSHATWIESDLRKLALPAPHDLVLIPYSLDDLTPREQDRLLEEAWFVARRALLVVQPGTQPDFDSVRRFRSWLTGAGARLQAPCPHDAPCPVPQGALCHFSVRLDRSRAHRLALGGSLGFEDEKFSYVLALKEDPSPASARIVRPPAVRSHFIEIALCQPSGIERARITQRDRETWRAARKADWGDRWEMAPVHISPTL